MGASPWQIIRKVLINEARAGLVSSLTILTISFLSYSAVAGWWAAAALAIWPSRCGYYRFQTDVMLAMVALLVVLVQLIQWLGGAAGQGAGQALESPTEQNLNRPRPSSGRRQTDRAAIPPVTP